jgi:hypothetical protein
MNRVILQLWEESDKNNGIFTDGCSIHIDEFERKSYISRILEERETDLIPHKYDRAIGGEIEVFISDSLYELVSKEKSLKLTEVELNNLIRFEEIIYNYATI